MKPTEEAVMEVLRKSTLSYLSEKQYAEIIEAVEKQGLINLSGAALRIVSEAVKKHGSHNQASHGRKGGRGSGGGGSTSSKSNMSARPLNADNMKSFGKAGDVETTAGTLDKLFGKGKIQESDGFERKVTEEWAFQIKDSNTGKTTDGRIYDWMRYDELGLSEEEGVSLPPLSRSQNFEFSVAAASPADAKIITDYIADNS